MENKHKVWSLLLLPNLFIHVYIEQILPNFYNTDRTIINAKRDIKINTHGASCECVSFNGKVKHRKIKHLEKTVEQNGINQLLW